MSPGPNREPRSAREADPVRLCGLFVDYDYLLTGEATRIRENGAPSGIGVLATYAYDNLGRRTSLTRGNGTSVSYSFDNASRLAQLAENMAGTTHDLTLGFTYNPASQIVANSRSNDLYRFTAQLAGATASTVNGLNQLLSHGGAAITHDPRGNMTSDGTRTYGYSPENMLTSATGGATLAYDPALRLYQVAGAATTRFLYDGPDAIAEYNGSNVLQRRFVHGPGAEEPLVWYDGAGTTDRRFLHADERGSIVAISNASGTVTSVNTYDEYGRPGTANVGRFQYTGQKWIAELGLYDYKARMYHPGLGRFMQTDPIGYASGMNLYAYVRDDPVNFADPFGLSEEDPFNWHIMYRADPPPQPGGIWDCNPRLGPCVWRPDIGITAGSSSGPSLGMSLWARSVGMPLGRELLGRGSGGDTGANRRPQPERPQEKPFKKLARCAAEQFGIDDLVDAGLVAAGQPIRGTKPFVTPGSSRGTSLAGMAADEVFGNARLPRQLPTVVGGPGTGRALAISGTKSVARFAGRAVPVIGWVMLAYDVASIAACAASGGE